MNNLSMTDIVGTLAALCSMASFTPQIIKIWREKDATSVSLLMYVVTVTGFALWIAYGIFIGSWPVAASNVICLALSAAILALKWRFRGNRG
ncbi:MAG: SemiSWEET transporter [Phenylobacterium sp.]|nr:SemiSWEET transporter [Phenylobacterium sp.]